MKIKILLILFALGVLVTVVGVAIHAKMVGSTSFSIAQNSFVEPGTLTRDFSVFDAIRYNGYQFTTWFNVYPLVVRISYLVVVSSILVWLFTVVKILVNQWFDRRRQRIFSHLYEQYYDTLNEILYSGRRMSKEEIVKRMALPKDYAISSQRELDFWFRIYIVDHVKRVREVNRSNEMILLRVLHMREYLEHTLLEGTTSQRISVMQAVRYLSIPMNGGLVARLVNTKNYLLRREARLFYMINTYDEPFEMIDNDETFTLWDRMEIHLMMSQTNAMGKPLPPFYAQIQQTKDIPNKAFLIQELGYFGAPEDIELLLQYLDSTDDRIFRAAVKSFAHREYEPAVEPIKANYRRSSPHTRRLILRSLLKIHAGDDIEDFYAWCYDVSPDFKTKRAILRCLWEYSLRGKRKVVLLRRAASPKEQVLFLHIQNEILRSTETIKL
ncbi:hypothetical protein HMPREF9135_1061 [Segatella baroniae F0067]|uniref:HEAT repeat domain-containing protein n=1 Tax=Segatella baroniae F0067 TaxID=1115809 RepID=U2QA35_9BACT|nr:HEAT repeat domain-containing protein [Segatella baroniae]ERK38188.1 hypothetical protein HMPREF9135_1061 [Segatella baroniae F0067]